MTRFLALPVALLFAAGLLVRPAGEAYIQLRNFGRSVTLDLPGVQGVHVSPGERDVYEPIGKIVRANTGSAERIYVGVARHDAVVIGNPHFYYLCDRLPAVRHHEMHPGITDREDVQAEMISQLTPVNCVILWRFGWSDELLDEIKARRTSRLEGTGSTRLDEFIAEHFEPVFESGEYVLMWRKRELPVELEGLPRPR